MKLAARIEFEFASRRERARATMVFKLFRRSANQTVIDRLYAGIVMASRRPALFTDLGLTDTFEGRFESLTLHAALVLRRLNAMPVPGPEMAQDLVDTVFRHFDRTLREMGVGDTTVPKRMKQLAEAFLGRSAAYDEALRQGPEALARTLGRNIYAASGDAQDATDRGAETAALAAYVDRAVLDIGAAGLQMFVDADLPFPDPSRFSPQANLPSPQGTI